MSYYPLFLEIQGRLCLVIGGGPVAFRKAAALLRCGAKVTVVSPSLSAGLKRMSRKKKIRWIPRRFSRSDLSGMELAVSATDDPQINRLAAREAGRRRVWINVVDQPRLCSFILPSVVRRGKLTLAVSTGGASPALAQWIRRDLEARYGEGFSRLLAAAGRKREEIRKKKMSPAQRKRLFQKALKAYLRVLCLPSV